MPFPYASYRPSPAQRGPGPPAPPPRYLALHPCCTPRRGVPLRSPTWYINFSRSIVTSIHGHDAGADSRSRGLQPPASPAMARPRSLGSNFLSGAARAARARARGAKLGGLPYLAGCDVTMDKNGLARPAGPAACPPGWCPLRTADAAPACSACSACSDRGRICVWIRLGGDGAVRRDKSGKHSPCSLSLLSPYFHYFRCLFKNFCLFFFSFFERRRMAYVISQVSCCRTRCTQHPD